MRLYFVRYERERLQVMQAKLEKLNKPLPKIYAAYYGEDWKTRGDWVGRYGRQFTILCAANAPYDRAMYYHRNEVQVSHYIGLNTPKYDVVRHWVHWLKTDNPRTLYDPFVGSRRQAEWDDHGEVYPLTMDGPDLWYMIDFKKAGVYRLSMYFFNKDGHNGNNRMRDYVVEIFPVQKLTASLFDSDDWRKLAAESEKLARGKALNRSRVADFWGGCYKTFVVTGSNTYAVKVDRNYSFNTILSSVMVDRIVGEENYYDTKPTPWLYVDYKPPMLPQRDQITTPEGLFAFDLLQQLRASSDKRDVVKIEKQAELQILKLAAMSVSLGLKDGKNVDGEKELVRHLIWATKYWNEDQRNEFDANMKAS